MDLYSIGAKWFGTKNKNIHSLICFLPDLTFKIKETIAV